MFPTRSRTDRPKGAGELAKLCLRRIEPWAGRLIGAAVGIVGSWFGVIVGFVIGTMVDSARESRAVKRYLKAPSGTRPEEGLPGLTAAAALSQAPFWPGPADGTRRRELFLSSARAEFAPAPLAQGRLTRLIEAVAAEPDLPFEALARDLSQRGGDRAQLLLATFAWTLAKAGGPSLDHGAETGIVTALADAGCSAAMVRSTREALFPGYRNPWEVLGLLPGASLEEIKRAWRQRSRRLHPDHGGGGGGDDASAFQAAREAYEFLKGWASEGADGRGPEITARG